MSKQQNYNTKKHDLKESDIEQILALVCYRCQAKTWQKIRARLNYFPLSVPEYGILERLMFENGQWSYCAGQSYPCEIKTLRNIFLNDYKEQK